MKNLRISLKLILCFLIVIVLSVIVGLVGIFGMSQMNAADDKMYNGNYLPTIMAGDISQTVVIQRVALLKAVIYDAIHEPQVFAGAEADMASSEQTMQALLAEYDGTIVLEEDRNIYNEFVALYNGEWKQVRDTMLQYARSGDSERAKEVLGGAASTVNKLDELTSQLQEINMADGKNTVDGNTALFKKMTLIEIAVLVVSAIIAILLALYVSRLISKPTRFMKDILLRIGTKGDLEFSDAEYRQIEECAKVKDEVGESVDMLLSTVRRLVKVGDALGSVAAGDLTAELALLSDRDTMGLSLEKMIGNLNNMFGEIHIATAQVSTGSKQIADGSQALAQGSTEQAAAVEQLSSSISEIAQKTKENADLATRAATLANTIKHNAEKGSSQMDQMMEAVKEINQASQSINKVIKVIDDIAFQTNILALNAAVEAARAGQHGKGFAVVAEEVRNLAAKSAEAAKDTGGLIANSMEKAELGARIADETAASLVEIVQGINESSQIVGDIATSSGEQSLGIAQINKGIDQVAQVIQQNSATAEESAAASEEMSGQANMLEELIEQFKLKDGSIRKLEAPSPQPSSKRIEMPAKPSGYTPPPSADGDFGKY